VDNGADPSTGAEQFPEHVQSVAPRPSTSKEGEQLNWRRDLRFLEEREEGEED
jgi:hypothetical protein